MRRCLAQRSPRATVDTGFLRTVSSDGAGAYRLDFLPIGNYAVQVTLDGFKTSSRSGIVLSVNDTARVDVSLSIGGVSETVTVESAAPVINTATSDISQTMDARAIESLPLVNRNVYSLLDLVPGVQSNNSGVATGSPTTSTLVLGFPEQRTLINGGADGGTGSVNYYLDGGINMTGLRNTGNILPNPDAIQEFKVQTNSYNVEYGRFASGVINVITKSGTNRNSGSLFGYSRSGRFDAKDWGSLLDKPPLNRRQFGGTLGGPITRDKTFFFVSYSGLRQTTSTFLNTAVCADASGAGGRLQRVKDPAGGSGHRRGVRLQRRQRRHLRQPPRSGGDEDHQHLHPWLQCARQHLAGLCAEPVRLERGSGESRPPARRRASVHRQLLPDLRIEHRGRGHRQPAVGPPAVRLAATQRQRQ